MRMWPESPGTVLDQGYNNLPTTNYISPLCQAYFSATTQGPVCTVFMESHIHICIHFLVGSRKTTGR